MRKFLLVGIIVIIAAFTVSIPLLSNQLADAKVAKKIQFTQTITSRQDPGIDHQNEQLALLLPPDNGSIYYGTVTYSSSQPVQMLVLHQIDKSESKGQPIWSVDGNTLFAETVLNSNSNSGTSEFAGSALAFHSNTTQFTVTASVDGWIRIVNPQVMQPAPTVHITNSTIKLLNTTTQIKIPLREGLFSGKPVYYIITDSSNSLFANQVTEKMNWKVQPSPKLAGVPINSYGNIYVFTNGIAGNGLRGFQDEVFAVTPSNKQYSPLNKVIEVTWNIGREPHFLNSTQQILDANMTGKLRLTVTDTIVNTPQIIWPGGSLSVRNDKPVLDETSYMNGQVLGIDSSNTTVTFVGHRGWGPDGKTVYYIVPEATPQGPADMMKITGVPTLSTLESSARDLYHFTNGFKGAGPFGYQEGVTSALPGSQDYTPICKVSNITWKDPQDAKILENMDDINSAKASNEITIEQARVLNENYILDCPIITSP